MTLASFNISGTTPVEKDRFVLYENGRVIADVISFSRCGPMLSGPAPLLLFMLLIKWISN